MRAATERVRVGVIGAGPMGLHHCRSLVELVPQAELAAVADLDVRAAERAASLAAGASALTDHRELLADSSIAAVVIATPADTHARLIEESSQAGKDIFCEKPLALDLMTADSALAEVARHGVKVQIGFQRRFDAGFRAVRTAVLDGEIGGVELVLATTRDPKPPSVDYMRRSGGLFTDTLIHDLDTIRFLTGLEAVEVYATASTLILTEGPSGGLVDTAVTSLKLETGALAVITNSLRAVYGYEVAAEVLGEKGKVKVGQEQLTGLRTYTAEGVRTDHVYRFQDRFRDAFVQELAHFVECVASGRQPDVTGEDGRAALALAVLAARSAQEGRALSVSEAA